MVADRHINSAVGINILNCKGIETVVVIARVLHKAKRNCLVVSARITEGNAVHHITLKEVDIDNKVVAGGDKRGVIGNNSVVRDNLLYRVINAVGEGDAIFA